MRLPRAQARRRAARGCRDHRLLPRPHGALQGAEDLDLRLAAQDLDRERSRSSCFASGRVRYEGARKGEHPGVRSRATVAERKRRTIHSPSLAEAWKSAMSPWLSWSARFDSAVRSRATPLAEAAAKALDAARQDARKSQASFSDGLREMAGFRNSRTCRISGKSLPSVEPAIELMAVAPAISARRDADLDRGLQALRERSVAKAQGGGELRQRERRAGAVEQHARSHADGVQSLVRICRFAAALSSRGTSVKEWKRVAISSNSRRRSTGRHAPELDDIYRRLHELRRESAALRQRLDTPKSAATAAARGRNRRRHPGALRKSPWQAQSRKERAPMSNSFPADCPARRVAAASASAPPRPRACWRSA